MDQEKKPAQEKEEEETSSSFKDEAGAVGANVGKKTKPQSSATHSNESTSQWLAEYMAHSMGISKPPEKVLEEFTLEGIVKYIKSGKCHNIITMAGAGISTSAGIPDFRSPGTGLYDNLQAYNLPNPQSIFEINYFQEHPEPFFMLARELWPGHFKPTPTHYFIKMLADKGLLLRHYTQNIDTLERLTGMDPDDIVEAHGTFHSSHCLKCRAEYSLEWMKEIILSQEGSIPKCEAKGCDGMVKPDIVFFGESLPEKFFKCVTQDFDKCDLLIILGTSLVVQPFASLTSRVPLTCPRLYINMEKTGAESSHPITVLMYGGGFQFDSKDNYRDVFWQGSCDDGIYAMSDLLGWKEELMKVVSSEHVRIDAEIKKLSASGKGNASKPKTSVSTEDPEIFPKMENLSLGEKFKSSPSKAKESSGASQKTEEADRTSNKSPSLKKPSSNI
ncbi:hypothetical protein CHS0354_020429 [Potamilus streckersoni]|uniref:protein acetyllysine N-acetyltransferase n=1 Tax=Potamilus streckersoni TaxID=2493646 RepID=A0AAE0SVF9_9BIVA|nr:hypothetical protein CHS0354_020429 [Potamilus streckersoni]